MTIMTMATASPPALAAPNARATARMFDVTVANDWSRVSHHWRPLIAAATTTPFQKFAWLDAWYRHIAPANGLEPRLVTVRDRATGGLVMLLPLASGPGRFGSILTFADAELSDFNAPILGPVTVEPGFERTLWSALVAALDGCAVANFRKMPRFIRGRANPLAGIPGAFDSSAASNAITLTGTFSSFNSALERRVRMELERCWRVLRRDTLYDVEHVTDAARAHVVLDAMDAQQRDRLNDIGSPFSLDHPAPSALYRDNLTERLAAGTVQLVCLRVGDEIIAALYAISDGHTAVVLRISNAGKSWSRVSPGRLIIHKSLEHFYRLGLQTCDLSIGDYEYKRRFGVVRTPLVDLVAALTWRGKPASTRHWAVSTLRRYPALDQRVRQLTRLQGVRATAAAGSMVPAGEPQKVG